VSGRKGRSVELRERKTRKPTAAYDEGSGTTTRTLLDSTAPPTAANNNAVLRALITDLKAKGLID
jgi:hypothetical protein